MLRLSWEHWSVLALVAAITACNPQIGDSCTVSTDCSQTGDRLCDTTQPGGYCTIFNCEPGTCPSEAICVGFLTNLSNVCKNPQTEDRFLRTFCLRNCSSDSDCRSGYICADLGAKSNKWGAEIMDFGDVNGAVCIPPYSAGPPKTNGVTEVCTGTDAGFDVQPWEPDSGVGDAGTDADAGSDAGVDASDASNDASDAGTDAGEAGTDASSD